MDKALISACLQKARDMSLEGPVDLNLEEAGALKAFLKARVNKEVSPAEKALHQKIAKLLTKWKPPQPEPEADQEEFSEERRTQLALREAIDKVQQERWEELTQDEVRLLRGTHEVYMRQAQIASIENRRLRSLLARTVQTLNENNIEGTPNAAVTQTARGKSSAADYDWQFKHHIEASTDLNGGNITPISILDEIEVDLNVRLFEFEGDTEVRGDIPSDVLVRVRAGGVRIDGFVGGNIVTSGNIEITGNAQGGTIVSTQGNITVAQVLIGTTLIAQSGDIVCAHLEGAKKVFAWRALHVEKSVLGGIAIAGEMHIKDRVNAAILESCGCVTANSLEVGTRGPTIVCLRERLTCEDYGRPIDDQARDHIRRIHQLESDIASIEISSLCTRRLMHNCYRTGLFYLLGGVDSAVAATELHGLQLKTTLLRQVIAIAEGTDQYFRALEDESSGATEEDARTFLEAQCEQYKEVQKDIDAMPDEFGSTHNRTVYDRCREGLALFAELLENYLGGQTLEFLDAAWAKRLSDWRGELGDTTRKVKARLDSFGLSPEILDRIERRPDDLEGMLDDALRDSLKSNDEDDRRRAKSPLIRLLKESAARYGRGIQESLNLSRVKNAEFATLRKGLFDESIVLFGGTNETQGELRAAQFDKGVIVTASSDKKDGFDTDVAEVIVLSEALEKETIFRRRRKVIERVSA